ncbi:efflux RND transporter permease subunit [Piscinibacter sp.]|uniref:efflux RND transporter permease subunit n=1 Tax=Piscinibacter sp. TaxID=1903157 RepID=UPI0035AE55F4
MWITRVSIANPVFATMVMVALCVLGLFSYARLGVEQLPDVQPPVAFIDVAYPGASPEAVEREVSKPIEEGLNSIAGIKHITSRSFEGRSQTSVEFTLDADMARAMQDVRDRMAVVQGVFPKDAKTPTVARFNNDNSSPVVVAALLSAARSPRELSILADQTVARRLQRVEGVASVEVNGLARREVRIDLAPDRLRAYAITPAQVAAGLREAHSDQPVGLLSDATQDAILRVEGRVADPRQFADMVVAQRNGLPLRLADLGTVVEREREPESVARVNGQRAVNFNVFKQQDANTVATGEAIKGAVEELRKSLPADVELRLVYASSDFVKGSLQGVQHTLVEGALLTVAIVFLFLHSWRSTVITGLTLPIAVIASFIAVHAFGFTLNFMTMMALSLCIGLLIDDAIVVRENIVRHLHLGKDHFAAARDGTEEIGLAVMATTFAICAVFVPVAFMGGIVGKFFHPFGITVTVAVLVSLFVSFTLDPMLSSRWPDPHDAPGASARRIPGVAQLIRAVDHGMDVLHAAYERLIHWVFERPRRNRAIVLAVGGASFLGALALAPVVGSEFVPQTDQGFTQLAIRMTVGSSLARSDEKVRQVEAIVAAFPEVQTISTNVGGQGTGLQVGRNQAVLNIGLVERARRARSQKQVEDAIRAEIARIAGIEVSVGFDRPIYVAVLGNDSQALARVASDLAEQMKTIPGITDVELSVKPGIPAYAVRLRPGAVRELGLTAPQLAASLRAYVNGEVGTYWTTPDGEQAEVLLRLPEAQRQRVAQMGDLPVAFAKDGTPIPLAAVASIEPVTNPEVIRRQDLQRREAIFAGVQGRPAGDVGADVQKLVKATALPPGVRFDVGGATREQQDAFAAMLGAMGLAVIFIYIVLASQFGSFLQPIAIMASLPLSLIGVMLALLAWRSTLNVFSMIGLIMLMGLVTKNAILLVDFANRALKGGASVPEALLQAGQIRMRPIIMTTAAMVFGMLPLALALNDGGELQAPMGRAIIGGVITSTLLTLVVVPVLWSVLVGGSLSRSPQPRRAGEEQGAQTSPAR